MTVVYNDHGHGGASAAIAVALIFLFVLVIGFILLVPMFSREPRTNLPPAQPANNVTIIQPSPVVR